MKDLWRILIGGIVIALLLTSGSMAYEFFERLTPETVLHGFAVENLYLDARNEAVGARLLHKKTGFTLDLFQIQSVPQAFIWVNTPAVTDMGEPHTCEHLLLGKGNKGRYVSSLEEMSLGQSTAYTSQVYTAYPFSSAGGNDAFFDLMKAKLDALLYPNYSDEEIRREVCNIGVTVDSKTGRMSLDEKGTIYTEMVSAFEKYWYYLYRALDNMIYGPGYPLATITGGAPEAIRKMGSADLRAFHQTSYQLNNMGIIATAPADIEFNDALRRIDGILRELDGGKTHPDIPPRHLDLPSPQSTAPPGEIRVVDYPASNDQEPGQAAFAWPAMLELDAKDMLLLKTFLYCLGGNQTSNLYNKFVNSRTRVRDIGATSVSASVDDYKGHAVYISLSDVKVDLITDRDLVEFARMIRDEIAAVAAYAPGSPELADFNSRARGYLENKEKEIRNYLNSPPGFGNRGGSGGRWYSHLNILEMSGGYHKSLLQKEEMTYALAQLGKNENIWAPLIAKCRLVETPIYAVGGKANPQLITNAVKEKDARMAAFTQELLKKYNLTDPEQAIARYKAEYDGNTAIIEEEAAKVPMPKFLENPPLSYDPQLVYRVDTLAGTVPLVSSFFNSMTSATAGLALDAHSVPRDKLLYLPFLPSLIREIGVIKDGQVIDYATLDQKLKTEILNLRANLSANPYTGRVELMIRGSGSDLAESRRAMEWMAAGLFHPYLASDNLPRIRDVVNNQLSRYRDQMKGSEESWVNTPAAAYLYQTNYLILAGSNFLTQHLFMHRLKWRLTGVDGESTAGECDKLFSALAKAGQGGTKEEMVQFASSADDGNLDDFSAGPFAEFVMLYSQSSPAAQGIIREALADLSNLIPNIPEDNVVEDWQYLAGQMQRDLAYSPQQTLTDIGEVLGLLRHRGYARMFLISNTVDYDQLLPSLEALASQLDGGERPQPQSPLGPPLVLGRMQGRYPGLEKPTYVGLVNTNTRNGVFLFSHPSAGLLETKEESLLDYLASDLYAGQGAHSIFMKTWGAGLAYSNGFRPSETVGRLNYYAERCPDLAVTMKFVVDELKKSPVDPKLGEYAIAQVFTASRGAESYEYRGEAMANNIADGYPPEKVAQFRRRFLDLRRKEGLYDLLRNRMESAYGRVLIGYGTDLTAFPGGNYFIIGPEAQFASLENYIAGSEKTPQTVYRIYPRDFWITQ